MPIAFLDFEASGLSETSYPIEAGWAREDSRAADAFLIRPEPGWTGWDPAAEALHRIPRALAAADGLPARDAAARLLDGLGGCEIYSDNPDYDRLWAWRLFMAAGMRPPRISHARGFLEAAALRRRRNLRDASAMASRRFPRTHRAGPDARHLLEIYLTLRRGIP